MSPSSRNHDFSFVGSWTDEVLPADKGSAKREDSLTGIPSQRLSYVHH